MGTAIAPKISASQPAPGQHQNTLTWQESDTGDTFNVYRSLTSGQYDYTAPLATGITVPSYIDMAGLVEGTTYFYEVTAEKNGVESKPSNEAKWTVPTSPTSPSNLAVTGT